MRKQQIICDGCGNEITGNPITIIAEYVDRDTGDYINTSNMLKIDNDYCEECNKKIAGFIKKISIQSIQKPINTHCEGEFKDKNEENKENEEKTLSEIAEKPINTKSEGTNCNRKRSELREAIRILIKEGFDNQTIAEKLNCPKTYVSDERYRLKVKTKPAKEKAVNTNNAIGAAVEQNKTVNCTQETMKKCKYGSILSKSNASSGHYCDYLSKVGHRRGCDTDKCDKFEAKKK